MKQIVECIPNFSEGCNEDTLEAIAKAIREVRGVQLLHQDSGKAANRTVFTFAGEVHSVFEAAFQAIRVAAEKIDMSLQKGEHPRIGACDVCPFVPISGIEMNELVSLVHLFAQKVSSELTIPVYLYEKSAVEDSRRNLANHRIGEYEGLEARVENRTWLPDFGSYNPKTGGIVMGARHFLIAYNINLNTKEVNIAKEIAYDLRELGRPIGKEAGKTIYRPGLLKKVKAIGWFIQDFNIAQVSINLTDYRTTSLYEVYETTKKLAQKYDVEVTGSELIGLIPLEAILETGKKYNSEISLNNQTLIELSIEKLGLSNVKPFDPKKRILEYVLTI